jgi:hypothetical protein
VRDAAAHRASAKHCNAADHAPGCGIRDAGSAMGDTDVISASTSIA